MWWSGKKKTKTKRGHACKSARGKGNCHFAKFANPKPRTKGQTKGQLVFQLSTKYLILSCVLKSGPCTCLSPSHPIIHSFIHSFIHYPLFITQPSLTPSTIHHTINQPKTPLIPFLSSTTHLIETFIKHLPQMPKMGKLTKLKSAIKRWPSLTKLSRNNSNTISSNKGGGNGNSSGGGGGTSSYCYKEHELEQEQLHAVYVGKSRRRYLVNSEVIDHPVFQELVSGGCDDGVVVSCEVVLFEHLLWMLESEETQLGSVDELVEFYSCACWSTWS